jgi:hypothetical protein
MKKVGMKFHWHQLVVRPFLIFGYYWLWKRGFAAGYRGLMVAALSTAFDFWAHAKLWELERFELDASPR